VSLSIDYASKVTGTEVPVVNVPGLNAGSSKLRHDVFDT
jgi:hypothetical protein